MILVLKNPFSLYSLKLAMFFISTIAFSSNTVMLCVGLMYRLSASFGFETFSKADAVKLAWLMIC